MRKIEHHLRPAGSETGTSVASTPHWASGRFRCQERIGPACLRTTRIWIHVTEGGFHPIPSRIEKLEGLPDGEADEQVEEDDREPEATSRSRAPTFGLEGEFWESTSQWDRCGRIIVTCRPVDASGHGAVCGGVGRDRAFSRHSVAKRALRLEVRTSAIRSKWGRLRPSGTHELCKMARRRPPPISRRHDPSGS